MPFAKMSEEERRTINFGFVMTKYENFLLECTASRLKLNKAEAVRRLIEEDNERYHYDLTEPEFMRPRNQGESR